MYRATYPGGDYEQVPKDYSGVAFTDVPTFDEPLTNTVPEELPTSATPKGNGRLFGFNFPFLNGFSLSKFGIEEILLIATAIILFMSKDGDKECALMLLLLLFVS